MLQGSISIKPFPTTLNVRRMQQPGIIFPTVSWIDGLGIDIISTIGSRLGSGTVNLTNFQNDDEKRVAPQNQTTVEKYIELINNLLSTCIHSRFEPLGKLSFLGTVMIELPDKRNFRSKFDNRADNNLVHNLELCLPP